MIRNVLSLLALVSMLLCILTAVLWVRTYADHYRTDLVIYNGENSWLGAHSFAGVLILNVSFGSKSRPKDRGLGVGTDRGATISYLTWATILGHGHASRGFGVIAKDNHYGPSPSIKAVMVPHWFATILFAGFPAGLLWTRFRRRRKGTRKLT
jgi:hypothetical protein